MDILKKIQKGRSSSVIKLSQSNGNMRNKVFVIKIRIYSRFEYEDAVHKICPNAAYVT